MTRDEPLPDRSEAAPDPGSQNQSRDRVSLGRPYPMGVRPDAHGVNVAVWAPEAARIEFCLFPPAASPSTGLPPAAAEVRFPLPFRDGEIWYAHIAGVGVGDRYGLRADGPWEPESGLRFNPHKLLVDPHARALDAPLRWDPLMVGHMRAEDGTAVIPRVPDERDSAPVVPRAIVMPGAHPATDSAVPDPAANRPGHAFNRLVIYEAHVRGLTAGHPGVPEEIRGTYLGAAHPAVIDHLQRLGVTAVEFLPLQAFFDDRHLVELGLSNYWGYQPLAWCAPEPRYATAPDRADEELRHLVHTLHAAGIEVIVDVVYNHSGEGDAGGPTIGPRGLHNTGYYRLHRGSEPPYEPHEEPGYVDDTGTGNTLAVDRPEVLRLVMDSLRHWTQRYGIDGFRFDLAATVGRGPDGFDPHAAFFKTVAQDPVLAGVKLIAEPWDLGPGGYRLGGFPHPWAEWNDTFRDGVRRLWRGEPAGAAGLGSLLLGSAGVFDHGGRPATASVNFVSAHDGFTLADVVSYAHKHNEANGEGGADGHDQNYSDNLGVEGPTSDPEVQAARARRVRGMLATLLFSQGVPMLLAGDEMGNSQAGNNNAYAQDNEIGWVDWSGLGDDAADLELPGLVARLIALRSRFPQLRQADFLHGGVRADGCPDVRWRRPDGNAPTREDWDAGDSRALGVELRGAAGAVDGEALDGAVFVIVNPGPDVDFALPAGGPSSADTAGEAAAGSSSSPNVGAWRLEIDTARPDAGGIASGTYAVLGQSAVVFSRQ